MIPGTLDPSALALLSDLDAARKRAFLILTRDQQEQAIRRLSAAGHSVHTISSATGLSVEALRCVLSPTQETSR